MYNICWKELTLLVLVWVAFLLVLILKVASATSTFAMRAKNQILKCKLEIRDAIRQLDTLGSVGCIDDSAVALDGSVYHEHEKLQKNRKKLESHVSLLLSAARSNHDASSSEKNGSGDDKLIKIWTTDSWKCIYTVCNTICDNKNLLVGLFDGSLYNISWKGEFTGAFDLDLNLCDRNDKLVFLWINKKKVLGHIAYHILAAGLNGFLATSCK